MEYRTSRQSIRPFRPQGSTLQYSRILRLGSDPRILEGLAATALQTLEVPEASSEWRKVQPRELKPLTSYNWTHERTPTIIVPGCPPIWQNKATPFKVLRDSGNSYVDQNRHRVPKYPLLPLFVALDLKQPDFDYSSIDIVTDRNNLRKLTRWVEGSNDRDFRIDIQLAGPSTVLLTRWESAPLETDSGRLGFGRNFEKYTTKLLPGCEKSTAHHRIITYDYAGLKLLVRFEVDACLLYDEVAQAQDDQPIRRNSHQDPDDALVAALGNMTINSDDKIEVIEAGRLVEQASLVEMTTRNKRSLEVGFDWQEYFPQLFLSGTPHHYLAEHIGGQFKQIHERTLRDNVLAVHQARQQESFDKLRVGLGMIIDLALRHGADARLSLVYRLDTKRLEVFESLDPSTNALPGSWMQRFKVVEVTDPYTPNANVHLEQEVGDEDNSDSDSVRTPKVSDSDDEYFSSTE